MAPSAAKNTSTLLFLVTQQYMTSTRLYIGSETVIGSELSYSAQLDNCLIYSQGIPRICNFILLLIDWVHSFSRMLPSVKFVEDKVLVFVVLYEKC